MASCRCHVNLGAPKSFLKLSARGLWCVQTCSVHCWCAPDGALLQDAELDGFRHCVPCRHGAKGHSDADTWKNCLLLFKWQAVQFAMFLSGSTVVMQLGNFYFYARSCCNQHSCCSPQSFSILKHCDVLLHMSCEFWCTFKLFETQCKRSMDIMSLTTNLTWKFFRTKTHKQKQVRKSVCIFVNDLGFEQGW